MRSPLAIVTICLFMAQSLVANTGKDRPELAVSELNPLLVLGADQVVREQDFRFEVSDIKSGRVYEKIVFTVFNEDARNRVFRLFYGPDTRIRKNSVTLYDKNGSFIRSSGRKDVEDYPAVSGGTLYQDDRFERIELTYPEYPYSLEIEYEKDISGIEYAVYPDWRILPDFKTSVEKASFTVVTNQPLHYRAHNIDLEPVVTKESEGNVYTWQVENMPTLSRQSYAPPAFQQIPMILCSPGTFEIDGYTGSLESWQEYGKFMYQLIQGRDVLTPSVAQDVDKIIADAATTRDAIEQLYQYMQAEVRYVSVQLGIGGWQPFSAEYVIENKYGDCKALSNYMMALLKQAGIESYPTLIQRGTSDYQIEDDFANPRFNHMVLYVPGEDMWLECTSTSYPAGYLGSDNEDRRVLLVTPEGGRVARTPVYNHETNREDIEAEVKLRPDGSARIKYQQSLHGEPHEFFRYVHQNWSNKEVRDYWSEHSSIPGFVLDEFQVTPSQTEPSANLLYSGNTDRYAAAAGKRLFVPLNLVSVYGHVPNDIESRTDSIYFNKAVSEDLSVRVRVPDGFQVEGLPEGVTFDSKVGTYQLQIERDENYIVYKRSLTMKETVLPPEEYTAFREFFLELSRHENAKMVLVEKKT